MHLLDRLPVPAKHRPAMSTLRGWMHGRWNASKILVGRNRPASSPISIAGMPTEHAHLVQLAAVIDDLHGLNEHTEKDFLDIGGKLMGLLQTTARISSGLNGLTTLIAGTHGRHASDVLARALERCNQLQARATERNRDLASLGDGARSVHDAFSGFSDVLSSFRVICTLIRIEAARSVGAVAEFGSLGEDVGTTVAEGVGARMENVLEAAVLLERNTKQTVASLSHFDVLLQELSSVIAGVMSSLASFSEQQVGAIALSARLAAVSHAVETSITNAMVSIQFHDITRQQVEHVVEALRIVRADAETRDGRLSREAVLVLTLQTAQLASAEERFATSVARLSQNLDSIAVSVREMSSDGNSLLNGSGSEQDSFFLKVEHCMTAILDAIGNDRKAEAATGVAAGELGVTVELMHGAARDIREMDSDLLRLALNASIRAASTGDSGATVGVLAGALQELAARSSHRSSVASAALDPMTGAVTRLSGLSHRTTAETTGQEEDTVITEMRSTIEELQSSSDASAVQIKEITSLASGLCADIAAAQGAFTAGGLFTEVVTRCRGAVVQLATEVGPAPDAEREPGLTTALAGLASRYTMQSQRDVHAAVTSADSGDTPAPGNGDVGGPVLAQANASGTEAPGTATGDASELGDNVELF